MLDIANLIPLFIEVQKRNNFHSPKWGLTMLLIFLEHFYILSIHNRVFYTVFSFIGSVCLSITHNTLLLIHFLARTNLNSNWSYNRYSLIQQKNVCSKNFELLKFRTLKSQKKSIKTFLIELFCLFVEAFMNHKSD